MTWIAPLQPVLKKLHDRRVYNAAARRRYAENPEKYKVKMRAFYRSRAKT